MEEKVEPFYKVCQNPFVKSAATFGASFGSAIILALMGWMLSTLLAVEKAVTAMKPTVEAIDRSMTRIEGRVDRNDDRIREIEKYGPLTPGRH